MLASTEVIITEKEYIMSGKKACIVADLRTGEHLAKIPDIVAVFSAAGWKTRNTARGE